MARNSQLALPVEVDLDRLTRKKTIGEAFDMCIELADLQPKNLPVPESTFTRWKSGAYGLNPADVNAVMDRAGNDTPLLWWMHSRGWDVHSFRKIETEWQRRARLLEEENENKNRIIAGLARRNAELEAKLIR